jgi:hypothetical protein
MASACKPCHFIYDGDIFAAAMVVFNQSAGSERECVVSFMNVAGANSFPQTGNGCPETYDKDNNPIEMIGPSPSCYTVNEGKNSWTPFTFSNVSGFVVSPHVKPYNTEFTRFDPKITSHIGKAPS